MRKKISILLCVVAAMLCFTGCGSTETVKYDELSIEETAEFMIEFCNSSDSSTMEQWNEMNDFSQELQLLQFSQYGYNFTADGFTSAMEAWDAAMEECGTYEGHGEYEIEASADEIKVTTMAQFSEREAEISFVFDETSYLESMTVNPEYSMGEILQKAGMNTILGMGTVFIVLIFISFLISLFKYIPMLEKKFKKQPVQESGKDNVPAQNALAAVDVSEETDDSELIAVIAAAIAAAQEEAQSTGEIVSLDGFVVRSIRRRPSNKWNA